MPDRPVPLSALAGVALLALAVSCRRDALFEAARRNDAAEVERLLARGADPNVVVPVTQSGHAGATFHLTPLSIAAQRGDLAMIERLIAAGADPHWDDGQFTAFEWAIRFEHPDAARRLWELSDRSTYAARGAIHIPLALRMRDQKTLDFVLNEVGADGCEVAAALSPLAQTGGRGSEGELAHVRALFARGARPTPESFSWAVREARREMIESFLERAKQVGWLLDCTAPLDPRSHPFDGALRGALISQDLEMVELLLEHGADPNAALPGGETLAMLLAKHVYLQEVYARPPYADPPYPSPSPFHEQRFAPLLNLLLAHGADLSMRDQQGRSAADYVAEDDHDRAIKRALLSGEGRLAPPVREVPSSRE